MDPDLNDYLGSAYASLAQGQRLLEHYSEQLSGSKSSSTSTIVKFALGLAVVGALIYYVKK